MKRFEYYSFFGHPGDEVDQTLDELGKEGWEAYSIVPYNDCVWVFLKREIQ